MVSYIGLSNISLHVNKLRKLVNERYNVNWTEYLALVAVNKYDQVNGFATATEVIAELAFNRNWTYNAINILAEKNLICITPKSNPWEANNLNVTTFGVILLDYTERTLKEMAREEQV
jgi:hypothetical protein